MPAKNLFAVLHYLKNLIQLILSPHRAWAEIAEEDVAPSRLLERGLYPLLAIVAVTAFCHGFYGSAPFEIGKALEAALAQFVALFLSVLIGRALLEVAIPVLSSEKVPMPRLATVPAYTTGILALINIIGNVCPIELSILWLLPLLLTVVLWQGADYLSISNDKRGQYIIFAIAVLIAIPVFFNFIFGLFI